MSLPGFRKNPLMVIKLDGYTSIFFRYVFEGRQLSRLPVRFPGQSSLYKMGSTLKRKDSLRWEQSLSFMR